MGITIRTKLGLVVEGISKYTLKITGYHGNLVHSQAVGTRLFPPVAWPGG